MKLKENMIWVCWRIEYGIYNQLIMKTTFVYLKVLNGQSQTKANKQIHWDF